MIKKFNQFNEAQAERAKDVNNLTGILDSDIEWYGEDKLNKSKFYEDFKKPIYSVRATFLNLRTYAIKFNHYSVKDVIAKWSLGKATDKLDDKDKQVFNDYLQALKKYVNLNPEDAMKWNENKFVDEASNYVTLFKLVQGIIMHESGQLDNDDLGEYKTVQQIVVAAFELETKEKESPPAYKKYGIEITSEEYKKGREEYLNGQKVEKPKEEMTVKKNNKDAFKNILKDFKS